MNNIKDYKKNYKLDNSKLPNIEKIIDDPSLNKVPYPSPWNHNCYHGEEYKKEKE